MANRATEATANSCVKNDDSTTIDCGCGDGVSRPTTTTTSNQQQPSNLPTEHSRGSPLVTFSVTKDMIHIPPTSPAGFTMGWQQPPTSSPTPNPLDWHDWSPNPLDGETPPKPNVVISKPFFIDRYPVSVGDFWAFVHSVPSYIPTSYEFNDTYVFQGEFASLDVSESLNVINGYSQEVPWWVNVKGVHWNTPPINTDDNPAASFVHTLSNIDPPALDRLKHPVVHVSFLDASKFCAWRNGARLPSETEWEYAARGGKEGRVYPWGNLDLTSNGDYRANYFQGTFPSQNEARDGHLFTNERGAFPPQNNYGLVDMVGNVWEWTTTDFDETNKVKKGGSFLCEKSYCFRYRNAARSRNTPDSTASNLGFRCVSDVGY